jgi:UDP-3-O-[3-hydroxymyristoyl] N-acetylglucosamine deacetylase
MTEPITQQRTIAKSVTCKGMGIHSGREVSLTIKPASANHGIKFKRTDLLDSPSIPAHFNLVVDTSLATVIGHDGFIVSTIEHLMAAFASLAIENALVEVDAYELPIMDGSAYPFTQLLSEAGIAELERPRYFFKVTKPLELKENGRSVSIHPWPTYRLTCSIEYEHPLIQHQTCSIDLDGETFVEEVSKARTFGFFSDYEQLKRFGLSQGCSLDNVLVVKGTEILNPDGLRYSDEFVRHKLLDCIGDFSLLGMPILGHVVAHKSGHAFNHLFLEKFLEQKDAWETCCPALPELNERVVVN